MLVIVILTGCSAAFIILGIYASKNQSSNESGIDRVLAYTSDLTASDDQDKTLKLKINNRTSRFDKLFGADRIEKLRVEALRADLPLRGDEWFLIKLLIPLFAGVIIGVLGKNMIAGLIGWTFAVTSIRLFVGVRIQKRLKAFTGQLNDALNIMANSLRAGYSFLQSVNSVSREMPDPIAHEFRRLLKELSLGQDSDVALKNLVDRVQSDDLALVVRAILIQRETGGNLAEILDTISTTIRDRVKIQGEIKTLTAQGRLSGMVVGTMPIVLIGIMYLINPEYISVLFVTPIGRAMLIGAFINEVIGMLLIRKIVSIEV